MNDNFTTYIVYIEKVKRDNLKRKLDDEYEMEKTVQRYQQIRDDEDQKEKNRKNIRQCSVERYHNENVIEKQCNLEHCKLVLNFLKTEKQTVLNNLNTSLKKCGDVHKHNLNEISLKKEKEKHSLESALGMFNKSIILQLATYNFFNNLSEELRFNYDNAVADEKYKYSQKIEDLNHETCMHVHKHNQEIEQLNSEFDKTLYKLDIRINDAEKIIKECENDKIMIEKYGTALPDDYFEYSDD